MDKDMILAKEIKPFLKNLRGAIHVGANIGEERYWYEAMHFTSVLWFEPNKELFPKLLKNIKPFNTQYAFNIGIHDSLKRAILHISNNDGQSSSLLQLGTHSIYHPDVTYINDYEIKLDRLDYFLEDNEYNVQDFNFINIDVQGTELNVLRSMGDLLGDLDYVYLEVNDEEVYKECSLLPQIDSYLDYFNFIRLKTKMTKAHWGDAFYIKEGIL
jgi:FkbM family methyltransferase